MTWVNTALIENMQLEREAVATFNSMQIPSGPQVPLYPCHVHGLLWPEKMTRDQLIHRFVVRHADPRQCILGSQARLLFIRVHVFGQFQADGEMVPQGWHPEQVMHMDQEPGYSIQTAQQELVYWKHHPWQLLEARDLTTSSKQLQLDVGEDHRNSRSKQSRNEPLASGQILGWTDSQASAHNHWKLTLKVAVYSNLCHVAMIGSQGHPTKGGCSLSWEGASPPHVTAPSWCSISSQPPCSALTPASHGMC